MLQASLQHGMRTDEDQQAEDCGWIGQADSLTTDCRLPTFIGSIEE